MGPDKRTYFGYVLCLELLTIIDISKSNQGSKESSDIFEWLSPSHWESAEQLSSHVDCRFEGTLNWLYLIPELNSWLFDTNTLNVTWITALPGVGKSTMAAHLLSTIHSKLSTLEQNRYIYLCYFFCKDGEQKLMHAHNIVQTLSYQLAVQNQHFLRELNRTWQEENFVVSSAVGIRLLYNRLFHQPLTASSVNGLNQTVYCVIDGLDEARLDVKDGRSPDSEVSVLLKLLGTTPHVRLLVLSRSVPQIGNTMHTLNSTMKEISATDNEQDIERFVAWKVSQSAKLRDGFGKLDIDPVTHVCKTANGNFLWVEILLAYLEGSSSMKEFESGLLEIPVEFQDLYSQILKRIVRSVSTSQERSVIKEVIQMVIASPRELQIEELQAAVELILEDQLPDFARTLKLHCGTFIHITRGRINVERKHVRVVHETFREFIISDETQAEGFQVNLPEAHSTITRVLLRYLCETDFGAQLTVGKFVQRTPDLACSIEQKFQLLKYASTQWSFHLRQSTFDSAEELYSTLEIFLLRGPILLWIESLAVFQDLAVLSRTSDDLLGWVKIHARRLPTSSARSLESWARDLARFYSEYASTVSGYPNSVYQLLFDLFPSPSLFHSRCRKRSVSIADGIHVNWNPAFVGINHYQNYESAVCSEDQKLFAFASENEICLREQVHGETVDLIKAQYAKKWVVLAMALQSKSNMIAAVYVPWDPNGNVSYSPRLSIWDTDNRALLSDTCLELFGVEETLFLVDRIAFTDDGRCVLGSGWKFILPDHALSTETIKAKRAAFTNAAAVILSPDGQTILKLESGNRRVLVRTVGRAITFNKPLYYLHEYDDPSDCPERLHEEKHWRWNVAPLVWWHYWREVTRAYTFSSDSRWFARFTDQNCVMLHDLETQTERLIYQPPDTWTSSVANNLAFDRQVQRLLWTFDHTGVRKTWNTRVEVWDLQTISPIGGFQFGRCMWRERVDFCSEPCLVSYRVSVSRWNIMEGLKVEARAQEGSLDWKIGAFAPGFYVSVGYAGEDLSFVNFVDDLTTNQLVTQLFDSKKGIGRRITYPSPLQLDCNQHKFPAVWGNNSLAMGDTILNLGELENPTVFRTIALSQTTKEVVNTAFHLTGELMACLQRMKENSLALHLYCTQTNRLLVSKSFARGVGIQQPEELDVRSFPSLIVFDSSSSPKFVIVLLSKREPKTVGKVGKQSPTGYEGVQGSLYVWIFEIESLNMTQEFMVPNFRYRDHTFEASHVLKGYFNIRGDKLICCEERRGLCCGQLWIIDMENETGISQFLPDFGRIEFMRETETVVAVTSAGWLQSKELWKMTLNSELGNENGLFLGRVDPWVLEGWKKLAYIPPRFDPCHESGIAFNLKGEVAYVCEFGKELVRVSFKW